MKQKNNRTIGLFFKVSPEEKAIIDEKMKQTIVKNQRAYLRKMAIDGYIISLDLYCIKEMIFYLKNLCSNINQITRRMNSTGNFYVEDLEYIKEQNKKILSMMNNILNKMNNL